MGRGWMGGVVLITGAAQTFALCSGCPARCSRCFIRAGCPRCSFVPDMLAGLSRRLFAQNVTQVVRAVCLRRMFADRAVCRAPFVYVFAPYVRAVCVALDVCAVCSHIQPQIIK